MTLRAAVGVVAIVCAFVGCTSSDDQAATTTPPSAETSTTTEAVAPTTTLDEGPDFDDTADAPPEAEGESTGPLGSTQIRVETDAGTVQIGAGSVPERLDPAFPLPADFIVELASETATDLGFSGTTELAFDELVELYETGLPAAGYRIVSLNRTGDFAVFEFDNDVGVGQVAISEAPGPAAHTLIVAFGDGTGDEAQLDN